MKEAVKSVVNILVCLQDLWYYRYITFKKGVEKRMYICRFCHMLSPFSMICVRT